MTPGTASGPAPLTRRASTGVVLAACAALALVIEAGSFIAGAPIDRLAERLPGLDKVLHALAFFVLYLGALAFARRWLTSRAGVIAVAAVLAVLAAGDELGQAFQPSRDLDPFDLLASLSGILLGIAWVSRRVWPGRALLAGAVALLVATGATAQSYLQQRHMVAAVQLERAGDFLGARREYRMALANGGHSPGLFNELSWVEIESGVGNAAEAVAFSEQALQISPNDPDFHDTYGWALHHAGRSREALVHLERAYAAKPDMFCIHYHLGEVYLALGQTEKAVGHLRQQVALRGTREALRAEQTLHRLGAGA